MLEIKCPVCSRIMEFDQKTGILICRSCNSEISVTKIDLPEYGLYKNSSYIKDIASKSIINDDEPDIANAVSEIRPHDIYEISSYIPFETSEEDALKLLRSWGGKKLFTKSAFNSAIRDKTILREYYPVFLFNLSAYGTLHSVCTINDDDLSSNITRTHYYDVYRKAYTKDNMILISASDAMSDIVLDGLLPYDVSKAINYTNENTDIKTDFAISKKASLLYKSAEIQLNEQIHDTLWNSLNKYSSKHNSKTEYGMCNPDIKAMLIPVWNLSYTEKNIRKHIYLNGNGKAIYGKRPLSLIKSILFMVLSGLILFFIAICIIFII